MGRRSKYRQQLFDTLSELQLLANVTGKTWFIVNPQPSNNGLNPTLGDSGSEMVGTNPQGDPAPGALSQPDPKAG